MLRPLWELPEGEIGEAVVAKCDQYAARQRYRRTRLKRWFSCYEGREVQSLAEVSGYDPAKEVGAVLTPAKSAVNAIVAKVGAKQRPKATWLTKGADYKNRVQAKYQTRFCEGLNHQAQGRYSNTWDLALACLRDAAIGEGGVIVVEPKATRQVVQRSRAFSWEYFYDPHEAEKGNPRECWRRRKIKRWGLIDQHDRRRTDILAASLHADDAEEAKEDSTEYCSLYEYWHLPNDKGEGGIYVATVSGARKPLIRRKWRWQNFPHAHLSWVPNRVGMWSEPAVERMARIQEMLNDTVLRVARNVRILSGGFIDIENDAYDAHAFEAPNGMQVNKRKNGAQPATITMPSPFNQLVLQWADWLHGKAFEQAQVSELNASGRVEAGITAAVAMRTRNDLQSELFLPMARAYEQLFCDIAIRDVQAARDLDDQGVDLKAGYERNGVMRMIEWSTVKAEDEDLFEVTVQAASSLEDTLAGRRQLITEWVQGGAMSPERGAQLLSDENPDPTSLSKRMQAQQRYMDRIIEDMLDVAPDEVSEFLTREADGFEAPDPYLDLDKAILQVTDAYVEALADDVPSETRGLLQRWIQLADTMVLKRQQEQAPPGPGMGMGMGMGAEGLAPEVEPMGGPPPPEEMNLAPEMGAPMPMQ